MKPAVAAFVALVALVAVVLGVVAGLRLVGPPAPEWPEIGGFVLDPPRDLPDFDLVDGKGRSFRRADFEHAWSFVYFGYTYCPDVCPTSLVEMAALKRALAESQPGVDVSFYLVTVDPERDTSAHLGEYVAYFDPEFVGLTGDLSEIDKLVQAAGAVYVIPEHAAGDSYLVGHSSTITLIGPDARIRAVFTSPLRAAGLAADFGRILERSGSRRN